ncbi:uncharacterized protein LOC101891846 isoform X1 [Musca domestica]|nr:uncharacterized protein LOC101891846 isoform X1 [Musca domestica]
MSSKRNFYEILNATPSATVEELKVNYKNLILQCHPDKLQQQQQQQQQTTNESSSSPSSSSKTINLENDPNYPTTTTPSPQRQEAEFVAITEAWNCLKDPLKRKRYDAELLLNKFHTHSNIYAHIQLKEMKKCLNTEIELEHHDDVDDDGSAQGGMESDNNNCHELPAYIYTYDCRCGGQYIVDESAEQYCRKVNNSGSSRSAGASSTLHDGGGGVQNDTKETTEGGVGVGGGDEHNNHDQNDDDNDDDADDDGELIVECSECSLVIILNG